MKRKELLKKRTELFYKIDDLSKASAKTNKESIALSIHSKELKKKYKFVNNLMKLIKD